MSKEKDCHKCEVFVDGQWKEFDGHGTDTESSREWYSKNFKPFALGSLPLRYNGVVNKNSDENSIFYILCFDSSPSVR